MTFGEFKKPQKSNQLEVFDDELLHPSFDIKNGVLCFGLRYRSSNLEESECFVVAHDGSAYVTDKELVIIKDKPYHFEKRNRKLARIEEKWGVEPLKKFLDDYLSAKPITPPQKVVETLVATAKRYIELEQEIDYYLLVGWIIGTYFFPAFYAYPFLHIKAPKRSGKSQCLNLLAQLCFNAVKARPSLAALGDTVDAIRGTYLIDQADALGRKGTEELLDLLADSYKKSGGKRRGLSLDKKKVGGEILEFETYGPKAFASIKELPEDLADRCLVVSLIRSQNNFNDPDDSNDDWRSLRGELYKLALVNHNFVSSSYFIKKMEYRQTPNNMLGRSLELWLPFEIILGCLGADDMVAEAKKRFLAQYGFSEYEPSELEEAVIKAILERLGAELEAGLTPKEISGLIDSELFPPSDSDKQRAAKVGWAIKKFNLSSEKKSRTKDGVRHLFNKERIEGIYKSYFKTDTELALPTSAFIDALPASQIVVQENGASF